MNFTNGKQTPRVSSQLRGFRFWLLALLVLTGLYLTTRAEAWLEKRASTQKLIAAPAIAPQSSVTTPTAEDISAADTAPAAQEIPTSRVVRSMPLRVIASCSLGSCMRSVGPRRGVGCWRSCARPARAGAALGRVYRSKNVMKITFSNSPTQACWHRARQAGNGAGSDRGNAMAGANLRPGSPDHAPHRHALWLR